MAPTPIGLPLREAFHHYVPEAAGNCTCLRTRLVRTAPGTSIVDLAKERGCDLIVMGAHPASPIATHMSPGTAAKVLIEAPCPVMTMLEVLCLHGRPCKSNATLATLRVALLYARAMPMHNYRSFWGSVGLAWSEGQFYRPVRLVWVLNRLLVLTFGLQLRTCPTSDHRVLSPDAGSVSLRACNCRKYIESSI